MYDYVGFDCAWILKYMLDNSLLIVYSVQEKCPAIAKPNFRFCFFSKKILRNKAKEKFEHSDDHPNPFASLSPHSPSPPPPLPLPPSEGWWFAPCQWYTVASVCGLLCFPSFVCNLQSTLICQWILLCKKFSSSPLFPLHFIKKYTFRNFS